MAQDRVNWVALIHGVCPWSGSRRKKESISLCGLSMVSLTMKVIRDLTLPVISNSETAKHSREKKCQVNLSGKIFKRNFCREQCTGKELTLLYLSSIRGECADGEAGAGFAGVCHCF